MDIKAADLLKATGGRSLGTFQEEIPVARISTDTRTLGRNDVFFALRGGRFDAHQFLAQAVEKGARHLVVSDSQNAPKNGNSGVNVIVVPDTLSAYGDLACFVRAAHPVPAAAITGSSGKTTVKELLAHILSAKFSVLKNRGTENNLVGVPKTILQLEPSHRRLVIEMGTNRPGEIARLSSIVAPQVGILTQIGYSHLEGLNDIEGVRAEKLALLPALERGGTLFVNGEDERLRGVQSGVHRVLKVGFDAKNNDFFADQIWCHEGGASFHFNGKELFEIPLIGRHNILNALLAIAAAVTLGVDSGTARRSLKEFTAVPGRLHVKNIEGIMFIDDSYNSNPTSLRAALETLKCFKIRGKKGVVFGDMLELGAHSEELHKRIGVLLSELMFDFVIATGPFSRLAAEEALKNGFNASNLYLADDSAQAGRLCRKLVTEGDIVLVKGSRGMKMEKVIECFTPSSTR